MNNLFIVSGAIGVGKTTLLKKLIPMFNLYSYELISTDLFLLKFFFNEKHISISYNQAREYTRYKLLKTMNNNNDVLWETVIAKDGKINTIKQFKEKGYRIICVHIYVDNIDICLTRTKNRNSNSLYSVDESRVIDRYKLTGKFLSNLFELSDVVIKINNTNKPKITYIGRYN